MPRRSATICAAGVGTAIVVCLQGVRPANAQPVFGMPTKLPNSCAVTSVVFSRDGQTLAAGDVHQTIKLWHASAEKRNWPTSFHANH